MLFRPEQQNKADDKEDNQRQDPIGGGTKRKRADRDDERAEEIGELAEDIEEAEILVRFLFGDDLAVIGARKRLDAALADPDRNS